MNIYRFLAYLLLLMLVVLVAALGAMLYEIATGGDMTPEIRKALLILASVILVVLLVILFLLCLARAKDRLRKRRRELRRPEDELSKERSTGLDNICDVLVRRKFPRPCLEVPIKVTRRPDPNIYSQFFLMNQGLAVTWDNPDVTISLGGIEQDTYNLAPATTYQVTVAVKNASPLFDAVNTQVDVNLLEFGVGGTIVSPITNYTVTIPAGTVSPGLTRTFNWMSPAAPGHYCIQVLISHPEDVNVGNNEGWNNTVVRAVTQGEHVAFQFPVWNRLPSEKGRRKEPERPQRSQLRLAVDSYELPAVAPEHADPATLFAPRAALWGATIAPADLQIAPGAAPGTTTFHATVPPLTPVGTRATFNVTAKAGGEAVGGVTIYLEVR